MPRLCKQQFQAPEQREQRHLTPEQLQVQAPKRHLQPPEQLHCQVQAPKRHLQPPKRRNHGPDQTVQTSRRSPLSQPCQPPERREWREQTLEQQAQMEDQPPEWQEWRNQALVQEWWEHSLQLQMAQTLEQEDQPLSLEWQEWREQKLEQQAQMEQWDHAQTPERQLQPPEQRKQQDQTVEQRDHWEDQHQNQQRLHQNQQRLHQIQQRLHQNQQRLHQIQNSPTQSDHDTAQRHQVEERRSAEQH